MKQRILASALFALCAFIAAPAYAQTKNALVVATCGSGVSFTAGQYGFLTVDTTGQICNSGGGGGGGGLSVVDGATFTASSSSFTPGGGEFASSPTTCANGKQCTFAITTNRALTVAALSGAIASGSIASGAVSAGAYAAGAVVAGAFVDGWDVTQGAKADSACGTATGTCSVVALLKFLNTAVGSAIPAGTNLIGDVNLRQGGTALSATNGGYMNCLLANAACATGTGAVGSTSQRVAVGTDTATVAGTTPAAAGLGATGSAVPSGAQYTGVLDAAGGTNMLGLAGDPCQTSVKVTVPFTLATAAVKVAITGVSAKKIYVCAYELTNNAADSVAIFEATTGTTCATSAVAVVGAGTSVASAATGFNFSANGGIARGNGAAQVLQTATNANDLCVAQSAATQLTGSFTYVTR